MISHEEFLAELDEASEAVICDGCLTAAYDEGMDEPAQQALICVEMGADIADHRCEARDEPGIECACACH